MTDLINFKGHFTIQAIDADGHVTDEWSDNNMIMESARTTMSKIFANIVSGTTPFVDTIKLGTLGHVYGNVITPKGTSDGFIKTRDRMFSESIDVADGAVINLKKNDCIRYTGSVNTTGTSNNYYIYTGEGINDLSVSTDADFTDTNIWFDFGVTAPYNYEIGFTIPGVVAGPVDPATITETDSGAGSTVEVEQSDSSVTFTFNIAQPAANDTNGGVSVLTEAALYANNDIFAMKTFKAKVKDDTVVLKIIWTITF